ncbi:Tyrosyl-tRNA synthetase [Candidatus Rhodobacter oscarellae]|uniref:Tyrosyl-tRNA synthetase n=1 Tax=Candidatus Rhodobacter oscarellae TaxID=1675527 RepID=A0A0J9E1F5_9RHOB|nr:Tyrosyl-tRNA synthetase [Candidatus Rhodobacter lobularis]
MVQLFVRAGLAKSGKDAKRLITENGARIDDVLVENAGLILSASDLQEPLKLSAGKKRHAVVNLEG